MGKAYDGRLMRRLLGLAKPYQWIMMGSAFLLIAAQGLNAYRPKIVQEAIDNSILKGDWQGLNYYALLFVAMLFSEFVIQYAVIYWTQWVGQKIIMDLRWKLFRHLEFLHLQFFDRNPVGRLITRLTSDIESLNDMFTSGMVYLLGDIVLLVGICGFMLLLDVKLTLVTFAILPIIFYISWVFKTKVRVAFREIRLKIASVNSYLQENITGAATVQVFNREEKNFDKFDNLNKSLTRSHLDSVFHYAWFYPAINVSASFATGLLLWYGSDAVRSSGLSLGTLVAFIQYAILFFRPIQDLSDKYNILQAAMASSERVFKLLDTRNTMAADNSNVSFAGVTGKIDFKNVWFSYDSEKNTIDEEFVLKDVSFEVPPGQSIAIVGATGSGKSSLINLLSRYYEFQRGIISIDGRDLRHFDPFELRKNMAVVLQDVFLFSGTILENIRMGREEISESAAREAARSVGAEEFIRKLPQQYNEPVQERGSTLSAGQRQLISLARAFAMNPKILVLDEATSNIDSETEFLIQAATKKLMLDRTSIVIAHRLSTIRHANRILVLHKGRVREFGGHDELLAKNGIYTRLYKLQYQNDRYSAA